MFDLTAFLDASEDPDGKEGIFLMGGMVTTSDIWAALEAQWRNVLAEEGLAEFHAVDCRHRKGAFSDRRWAESSERLRVRDRFLSLIAMYGVATVCVGVDRVAYASARSASLVLERSGYGHEYYLAYASAAQQLIQIQIGMNQASAQVRPELLASIGVSRSPDPERIGFVLDIDKRNDQAKRWHEHAKDEYSHWPLGGITFETSHDFPGLQAADLMAYEARQHLAEDVYKLRPRTARAEWTKGLEQYVKAPLHGSLHISHYDANALRFAQESFVAQGVKPGQRRRSA